MHYQDEYNSLSQNHANYPELNSSDTVVDDKFANARAALTKNDDENDDDPVAFRCSCCHHLCSLAFAIKFSDRHQVYLTNEYKLWI